MNRATTVCLALLASLLLAGAVLPAASATIDVAVDLSANVQSPVKGSNVTVTVVVQDQGLLAAGEQAVGEVQVRENGTVIGTAPYTLDANNRSSTFEFHWTPSEKGSCVLVARANTTGDVNVSNDMASLNLTVGAPKGLAAGELSTVATIVGVLALFIFFFIIIASTLGWIPQDRLPIQPALVLATFVIVAIAFIGGTIDDHVERFGPQQLAAKIIIHPISALISGFLAAGALEAAGAFEAAADGLQRLERLKIRGTAVFGITGTVVLLSNVPTILAMPCGRILAAALMPAALFFGLRVARMYMMPALVSVVVFAFIVNAAASCGPALIGGIGTIGEGLAALPTGSLSDAQQIGILLCTGVTALVFKWVTISVPPDLAEEEAERVELERAQKKAEGVS